jgi:uncharacterized SAM-binding protein YcdF (DUF218 family)
MKTSRSKVIIRFTVILCLLGSCLLWWIGWGSWPEYEPEPLPWRPDVIIVLGGGNEERPREALRLLREYPDVPVVVTGDNGIMLAPLLKAGVLQSKIHHEQDATSTVENATFTDPILTRLGAKKVVLVTNWFHAPRSLAVFRRHQPERKFVAAFESKPDKMCKWHRYASRRERLAALVYLVRDRIWSF